MSGTLGVEHSTFYLCVFGSEKDLAPYVKRGIDQNLKSTKDLFSDQPLKDFIEKRIHRLKWDKNPSSYLSPQEQEELNDLTKAQEELQRYSGCDKDTIPETLSPALKKACALQNGQLLLLLRTSSYSTLALGILLALGALLSATVFAWPLAVTITLACASGLVLFGGACVASFRLLCVYALKNPPPQPETLSSVKI